MRKTKVGRLSFAKVRPGEVHGLRPGACRLRIEGMLKVVRRIVEERKTALRNSNEIDFVDVLLRDIEESSEMQRLPSDFITGNIIELMVPGEETMPTAMTLAVKFLSDCPVALGKLMVMDPTKIYKAAAENETEFFNQITRNEMNSYLQHSENILKPITDNEDSILHVATKFKRMEFAKNLISLNQSLIYLRNKKGDTPLHVAASVGCWDITKLLVDRRSDILESVNIDILETVNIDKDTALHVAVRNAQHSIVELLIGHKPGLAKMVNKAGEFALFLAVDRNNYHTANFILAKVPESICYRGRDRMNVLHVAIIRMVANFLLEVIKKAPNLASEADDFGWTPLHYAAHYGSVQVMELLLQYAGSSAAYIKDKEGMSALHIAAERGHLMVVMKVVSEFPSTYELLDNKGRTPLHVAAESGKSFWTLLFLIRKVPDDLLNKQDRSGNTILHLAAVHKRFKTLTVLAADKRFDKGAINKEGRSCLVIYKSSSMPSLFFKHFIPMFEAFGYLPSLQAAFPRRTIKVQTTGTNVPQIESRNTSKQEENDSSIQEKANVDLLVATFVATVTFAAIFTMPYREDGATSGQKLAFGAFAIANSISFVLSTASMFFHFYAFGMKEEIPDAFSGFLTWSELLLPCAVHALVVAYSTGSYGVMARSYPKIASWVFGLGFIFFIGPLFAVIKTVYLMAT